MVCKTSSLDLNAPAKIATIAETQVGMAPEKGPPLNYTDVDSLPDSGLWKGTLMAGDSSVESKSTKPCVGIQLTFPPGVNTYSAYPFSLHDKFSLPWDIHILSHRMWIQAINCKKLPSPNLESCQPCRELLHNNVMEGILQRIDSGIHENTLLAYQPIGGLIELV
jgi:hypothetical protein